MDRIFKLLYDYSKHGKLIDVYFVQNLINFFICEQSLDKYINRISIFENESEASAEYDLLIKDFNVYKLGKHFERQKKSVMKLNLTLFEYNLYLNMVVMIFVLHDLSHVKQNKYISENNGDEKFVLLNINFQLMLGEIPVENLKKYYLKNYQLLPMERMAEIEAFNLMMSGLDFQNIPTLKRIIEKSYLNVQLIGYSGYSFAPTGLFLNSLGLNKILNSINNNKEFSLSDKLYLGLAIEECEYKDMKRKIASISI